MTAFDTLYTADAPRPLGPYSQAVLTGQYIFLAGQIGIDPETNKLVSISVELQLEQVLKNMQAILRHAGGSLQNIVKMTIFMTDLAAFSLVNATLERYLSPPYPCRSVVEVSKLPKLALIEIEAIAIRLSC